VRHVLKRANFVRQRIGADSSTMEPVEKELRRICDDFAADCGPRLQRQLDAWEEEVKHLGIGGKELRVLLDRLACQLEGEGAAAHLRPLFLELDCRIVDGQFSAASS
jgi:hypothetical protein